MEWLLAFVESCWIVTVQMAPYLLLGFLVAGVLSILVSPSWVERHLGGRGLGAVVKASVVGVPMPLCSCGVIPVSAGLRRHGASRAAASSFLLSTPQTGVDSIVVTWSLLGPIIAIVRPIVAFATGVIGGGLTAVFDPEPLPPGELEAAAEEAGACGEEGCSAEHEHDETADEAGGPAALAGECTDACCDPDHPMADRGRLVRSLHYGFVSLPQELGPALIVGILLAGLMSSLVPEDYFAGLLGCGIGSMLVMMLIGVPIYVCATASVPIAAAFVAKGVCPGAALVFLIAGPATNMATLAALWRVLGRRAAILYLATVAVSAVTAGMLLELLGRWYEGIGARAFLMTEAAAETLGPWETASAVVLVLLLAWATVVQLRRRWRGAAGHGHADAGGAG
jgi:uncharacterized membrane protein YraQ (UPF0718 family)